MAASGSSEHVREGDVPFGRVPGGRLNHQVLPHSELFGEPNDHEAIGPVGYHRSTSHGFLAAELRVCTAQQAFGLSIGDLNAPSVTKSLEGLLIGSSGVGIEEDGVRVFS